MADGERTFSGLVGIGALIAIAALAFGGFFAFQAFSGDETTTTNVEAAPAATTTTTPVTATTEPPTTTTEVPTTTTTLFDIEPDPFVGWWKATDVDGSHLDLGVEKDGTSPYTFMYWDSASGSCEAMGLGHSPETWEGTGVSLRQPPQLLTVSGPRACFPYGGDAAEIGERGADFSYDLETDTLEFSLDGVRYTRSSSPPPSDASNPFVGMWEATDSDGTRVEMTFAEDGAWRSEDTRSGGCENMGLTYATWSAEGTGTFDLDGIPGFEVLTTTICHPVDGDPVPRSEDVVFTFEYRADNDEVALLLFLETILTRVG